MEFLRFSSVQVFTPLCLQVSGMIHFAQAVRGQSDLGRLMIKQMGEALDSAQPEAFTEAMFKLAALLISSKGSSLLSPHVNTELWICCLTVVFSRPASRQRPSAPAPPLLVTAQDVHSTRHGNRHRLLGVAAGSSCRSGSAGS